MMSIRLKIFRKFKKKLRFFYDRLFWLLNKSSCQCIGNQAAWYVPTSKLEKARYVVSGGVGWDISFETELAKFQNIEKILLFDPSSTGIKHIGSINLDQKIKFFPLGLAGHSGLVNASPPIIPGEGSFRLSENSNEDVVFQVITAVDIVNSYKLPKIDILKIDIEGFEYDFIEKMIDSKIFPEVILVEFHHFYKNISLKQTINTILLLRKKGYRIVHKKVNDFTFEKKTTSQ